MPICPCGKCNGKRFDDVRATVKKRITVGGKPLEIETHRLNCRCHDCVDARAVTETLNEAMQ